MAERSGYEILVLFALVICGSWGVHHYQFKVLPEALSPEDAGVTGFSEEAAMAHNKALSSLGPHPLPSAVLDTALQYVLNAATSIKEEASEDVNVEVECFHANTGVNTLSGGSYYGKTLVYSDMKHVLIRISSKSAATKLRSGEEDNAILVSAHVDTVFAAEGAGDDSSNVAVMLELARGLSKQASGFKNSVIFFFNTGEEEGLNGAHSFVTQHPWINTVRVAVDLEAMGIGGKSGIFQAGPDPWAVKNFAKVAKRPSAQIVSQDLFASGVIKSSTDFQVYKEVAGLSGLDFAFTDQTAVYHTKNDKHDLLKPGSLQHLGDNMLPFLLHVATSTDFPTGKNNLSQGNSEEIVDTVIYFDILGKFMVVYPQSLADMINTSVIALALFVWSSVLKMGGLSSLVSVALSVLSILLMWICSLGLSVLVAYVLPSISASPVPFIASPWLVIGLFAAPALLGAFVGQHVVYLVLHKFLSYTFSETKGFLPLSFRGDEGDVAVLESEKWMFKAGMLQWLLVLAVGNHLNVGSAYFALFWMVSPAVAYFLFEVLAESPKPLNPLTAAIGLAAPLVVSSGVFVTLVNTLIGNLVRFVSNPGAQADWIATAIVAALIAALVCLTMVYVLPYIHNSGAKYKFIATTCIVFLVSLGMVVENMVPTFIDDTARAVNIVQVVNTTGEGMVSHISLFSTTPGGLEVEAEKLGGGLVCGREKAFDFVTFTAYYSCWTAEHGWSNNAQIPALRVASDSHGNGDDRATLVTINTKDSTRWCLSINTNEIQDFQLHDESGELVSRSDKNSVDGWHLMQFAGGKNSPTKFDLTLHWHKNSSGKRIVKGSEGGEQVLLKVRADVNGTSPELDKILEKMPSWISQYGKSTSPYTFAYFDTMYVADASLTMGTSVSVASDDE